MASIFIQLHFFAEGKRCVQVRFKAVLLFQLILFCSLFSFLHGSASLPDAKNSDVQ
ncbi:hypothetical protein CHCC14820_4096 [Bacillus paralicheniformis]|uniref:Transmembrane protein n=1 Tax=Bacillus paralicheniformis TaxID=1648923 RepID=A0A7Z0X0S3_9BACI|nr:hypothetical protein B4121_0584 [Bacillus paralicheniformis]TWJ61938.1 hypothetical protein CHCC5022_1553 [Bacillus paralicheniformis]TWJ74021.1 hypothetical protein CHCC4186_2168 [Bacillus paralicheniformis]TWK33388.1 hypothetical protein CHCC20372_0420 [Bacillus paralicheniformis]TWK42926.1 hypothetical protein CHCC20348_0638 [Bacillus paralicheniformis]